MKRLLLIAVFFSGTLLPAAAQIRRPVQIPVPAVNESGSAVFDGLRNEAISKNVPLVIYMTGSSWCSHCNVFTRTHIKAPAFQKAASRDFVFWLVDSRLVPKDESGRLKLQLIPEEASKVIGSLGDKVPYTVLGPPSVFIIDPVSGKLLKTLTAGQDVEKHGKPLEQIIETYWKEHRQAVQSGK